MLSYRVDYNSSSYLGLICYIRNTTNNANAVFPTVSSFHPYSYDIDGPYKIIDTISETTPNEPYRWISEEKNYQWYQLEFQNIQITLTGYYIVSYNGYQRHFQILGSNDGINFDLIQNTSLSFIPSNRLAYIKVSTSRRYSIFRLQNFGPRFDPEVDTYALDLYRIELFGYVGKFNWCNTRKCQIFDRSFIGFISLEILF